MKKIMFNLLLVCIGAAILAASIGALWQAVNAPARGEGARLLQLARENTRADVDEALVIATAEGNARRGQADVVRANVAWIQAMAQTAVVIIMGGVLVAIIGGVFIALRNDTVWQRG